MERLESMSDFFEARVQGYDEHMLQEVIGCREGYAKMAQLIPENTAALLDLGCGTGLELDAIFKTHPAVAVTGIDLCRAMLDALEKKHPDKQLQLICGDYFTVNLPESKFDCAISFETMHHFSHGQKLSLYRRIWNALAEGGVYIECDYMVLSQEEEDFYFAENARLRAQQNIPQEAFYHYDTPCTVENQIRLLKNAGFTAVVQVFRQENTTMLLARK